VSIQNNVGQNSAIDLMSLPDERGHFGPYGGIFAAETLMGPLEELREAYETHMKDPAFIKALDHDLTQFCRSPFAALPC